VIFKKYYFLFVASRFYQFAKVVPLVIIGGTFCAITLKAVDATNDTPVADLKLSDYLQQVVRHNEAVQAQMIEVEVSHLKNKAEMGIFEPKFKASVTYEANKRTNDVSQAAAQNNQGIFEENNTLYDGGIESELPTGGKVRLGYTMNNLGNNLDPNSSLFNSPSNHYWNRQYQTFVGAKFSQPLLKDAGLTPTLANLRLSALDSDIAFQEYRRQLMFTIFKAEDAYWNLYFSQEQLRFFDQSIAVAQKVLDDSGKKLKSGQGSELDVMEAQSALALRSTKRNIALQEYYDALENLQVLMGVTPSRLQTGFSGPSFHVTDTPRETSAAISYGENFAEAFSLNPDYLIQQTKIKEELLRMGVAKNQLLPDLNLLGAYGFNGLGTTPENSWDSAQSEAYPSWSIGMELSVPLGGNIKERNLYQASKLVLSEAYVRFKGVQTEISYGLNTAIQKAGAWEQSIQSYQMVVHYNEELLKTQLERLKAGRVDGHKVMEVEADLLDARQELANALTQYQRTLNQVELTVGSILKNRNLDLTQAELRHRTTSMLEGASAPALLGHASN
jgi:outer membrane protein